MTESDGTFYLNVELVGELAGHFILEHYGEHQRNQTANSPDQQSLMSKFTGAVRSMTNTSQSLAELLAEILVDSTHKIMARLGYKCKVEIVVASGKDDCFFVALRVDNIGLYKSQASCCGSKVCCRVAVPVFLLRSFFCCPTATFQCCPLLQSPLNIHAVSEKLEEVLYDADSDMTSIPVSVACQLPEAEISYLHSKGFRDVKLPEADSDSLSWWGAGDCNIPKFTNCLGPRPPEISQLIGAEIIHKSEFWHPGKLLEIFLQDPTIRKRIGSGRCVLVQYLIGSVSLVLLSRVLDDFAFDHALACDDPLGERMKLVDSPVHVKLAMPVPHIPQKTPAETMFMSSYGKGNVQWQSMGKEFALQGCYIGVDLTSHWAARLVFQHVGLSGCIGSVYDLFVVDWVSKAILCSVRVNVTNQLERLVSSGQ